MNKNLVAALKSEREKGIELGTIAFGAGALIAAYNVNESAAKRYMSRPQFLKFFREWEDELARLFEEEGQRMGWEAFAETLITRTRIMRKEIGLDDCE